MNPDNLLLIRLGDIIEGPLHISYYCSTNSRELDATAIIRQIDN